MIDPGKRPDFRSSFEEASSVLTRQCAHYAEISKHVYHPCKEKSELAWAKVQLASSDPLQRVKDFFIAIWASIQYAWQYLFTSFATDFEKDIAVLIHKMKEAVSVHDVAEEKRSEKQMIKYQHRHRVQKRLPVLVERFGRILQQGSAFEQKRAFAALQKFLISKDAQSIWMISKQEAPTLAQVLLFGSKELQITGLLNGSEETKEILQDDDRFISSVLQDVIKADTLVLTLLEAPEVKGYMRAFLQLLPRSMKDTMRDSISEREDKFEVKQGICDGLDEQKHREGHIPAVLSRGEDDHTALLAKKADLQQLKIAYADYLKKKNGILLHQEKQSLELIAQKFLTKKELGVVQEIEKLKKDIKKLKEKADDAEVNQQQAKQKRFLASRRAKIEKLAALEKEREGFSKKINSKRERIYTKQFWKQIARDIKASYLEKMKKEGHLLAIREKVNELYPKDLQEKIASFQELVLDADLLDPSILSRALYGVENGFDGVIKLHKQAVEERNARLAQDGARAPDSWHPGKELQLAKKLHEFCKKMSLKAELEAEYLAKRFVKLVRYTKDASASFQEKLPTLAEDEVRFDDLEDSDDENSGDEAAPLLGSPRQPPQGLSLDFFPLHRQFQPAEEADRAAPPAALRRPDLRHLLVQQREDDGTASEPGSARKLSGFRASEGGLAALAQEAYYAGVGVGGSNSEPYQSDSEPHQDD